MAVATFAATVLCLALAPGASAFEWLGQYGTGSPGGSSGQVANPFGVAVAPDGTVVVGDQSNSRVSLFAPSGKFLRAFGKNVSLVPPGEGGVCTTDCRPGSSASGSGALAGPTGVAAGPTEIYVAEQGNSRISVFNYQGQFLRAFGANVGGAGVNVCAVGCTNGTSGANAGQLDQPAGIALDAAGELLVGELSSNRIDVFDPQTGQFLRAFGKDVGGIGVNVCTTVCSPGTGSNAPGALEGPDGVAVGPEGDVFVAEQGNNRISVFDGSGQFQRSFGSSGNGAGNLQGPRGLAVASNGSVYVADTFNNRLDVFNVAGQFQSALGWNVNGPNTGAGTCTAPCMAGMPEQGIGAFNNDNAVAVDCRGTVYVANGFRVDKYGEPGVRSAPCPSNAFSFGQSVVNKKNGTLTVEVDLPGPGSLTATAGSRIVANAPQPAAAGAVQITLAATGKGVKTLAKKGKLTGTLSVTFTPPNGDPNTQTEPVQLTKKVKKHKKAGKHKGRKHKH